MHEGNLMQAASVIPGAVFLHTSDST